MAPLASFKINLNGSETEVLGQVIGQKFWCRLNGETYAFDLVDISSATPARKKKNAAKSSTLIAAPMPGKITKIFVKAGDHVEKTKAVLVMEAMKMEYTLKSDLSSVIDKVNVQVGDQVTLGHVLIELKPEGQE